MSELTATSSSGKGKDTTGEGRGGYPGDPPERGSPGRETEAGRQEHACRIWLYRVPPEYKASPVPWEECVSGEHGLCAVISSAGEVCPCRCHLRGEVA